MNWRSDKWREARRLWQRGRDLDNAEKTASELVPLETPRFVGWERYWVVRPDVRRSDEGPVYDRLLRFVQHIEGCDRHGVLKERNYGRGGKMREVKHRLNGIDAHTYWAMVPRLRREFTLTVYKRKDKWSGRVWLEHHFTVTHPWKFVSKVRERYQTHERVWKVNLDEERDLNHQRLWGPRVHTAVAPGSRYQHEVGGRGPRYGWREGPHRDERQAPLVLEEEKP